MRYSRTGLIAVLAAAEVFILGAIIYSLGGHGFVARAAAIQSASPGSKAFAAIEAGPSPHVVIDDPDSDVAVTPSTDGKVHVIDESAAHVWLGKPPAIAALQVERTSDGVSIVRPRTSAYFGMSYVGLWVDRRIRVALPAASDLNIRASDGQVRIDGLRAPHLTVSTSDGDVELNDVEVSAIDASSGDGSIQAHGVRLRGGRLHTQDGDISLSFADAGNVAVNASTQDGSIDVNGAASENDDGDSIGSHYRLGSPAGSLDVSTQDGSIHIMTNGVQ